MAKDQVGVFLSYQRGGIFSSFHLNKNKTQNNVVNHQATQLGHGFQATSASVFSRPVKTKSESVKPTEETEGLEQQEKMSNHPSSQVD